MTTLPDLNVHYIKYLLCCALHELSLSKLFFVLNQTHYVNLFSQL